MSGEKTTHPIRFMKLKNITAYKADISAAQDIEGAFSGNAFKKYDQVMELNAGFIENPHNYLFVTPLSGGIGFIFSVKIVRRSVPASALSEELEKAVEEEEKRTGAKVLRKHRKEMKETLRQTMLAKAFDVTKVVHCVYHNESRLLIIDSGSQKDCDLIMSMIVSALGTIRTSTIHVDSLSQGLTTRLTSWLTEDDEAFDGFEVGGKCTLHRQGEESEHMSFELEDLRTDAANIEKAIDYHYQCTELELIDETGIRFTLTKGLKVRKIQHENVEREEHHDEGQHFVHEASVRTVSIVNIMNELCAMFGYEEPAADATQEEKND